MKIFIDGEYGTAGLCLKEKLLQLQNRIPFEFISISNPKSETERYQAIKEADIAILCLPEDISFKTCEDLKEIDTIIIDASTIHRTLPGWTYGFEELNQNQMNVIKNSKRIANPGCFATGMMAILNPIKDYLNQNMPLMIQGVTGYSAGGKKIIQKQIETPIHFRSTNLNREHIHLVEIKHWLNLQNPIAFNPSVSSFERGQMVSLTLFQSHLDINIDSSLLAYQNFYKNFDNISIIENFNSQIIPEKMNGRDDLEIYISKPSKEYIIVSAIYDNLGKGSAGSIAKLVEEIIKK